MAILSNTEAFNLLFDKGLPIKLKEWSGYWIYDKEKRTIFMHCYTGDVIDIKHTNDIEYTIKNILENSWEIATIENSSVLKEETEKGDVTMMEKYGISSEETAPTMEQLSEIANLYDAYCKKTGTVAPYPQPKTAEEADKIIEGFFKTM